MARKARGSGSCLQGLVFRLRDLMMGIQGFGFRAYIEAQASEKVVFGVRGARICKIWGPSSGSEVGMFPLILAVLHRDCSRVYYIRGKQPKS